MGLEDVKSYLRVDIDDDDALILNCIAAAKAYLKNATGIIYHEKEAKTDQKELARIFLLQLIADMYEVRKPSVSKDAGFIYQSMILQLTLNEEEE